MPESLLSERWEDLWPAEVRIRYGLCRSPVLAATDAIVAKVGCIALLQVAIHSEDLEEFCGQRPCLIKASKCHFARCAERIALMVMESVEIFERKWQRASLQR